MISLYPGCVAFVQHRGRPAEPIAIPNFSREPWRFSYEFQQLVWNFTKGDDEAASRTSARTWKIVLIGGRRISFADP